MDSKALSTLLQQVRDGVVTPEEASGRLQTPASALLGYATVDLDRATRTGIPEVVYGAGKSADQIAGILLAIRGRGQTALATRVDADKASAVLELLARAGVDDVRHDPDARLILLRGSDAPALPGRLGVVCAGTSDMPVTDEVAGVASALGAEVLRVHDVGIAGVHRILARLDDLRSCDVIIVVAGMDGALPGLVAGLVRAPVIAVPTSVGYGASFGGVAALLTMLNACAPGVSVVNIDNGFGAAYQAVLILRGRLRA